jgi:hypothetical protein
MAKVYDSWANKKAAEDEKQLRNDERVKEEALELIRNCPCAFFGAGGAHGKDFPFKTESNNEIVNDFTNETDFVKFSDERYVHFLESQVAQLQYKLHLLESGE